MKSIFNPEFAANKDDIEECIAQYSNLGTYIYNGSRNSLKIFNVNDRTICIKAFKKPHFFNKIIYTYFRKSKAKRSFEFAKLLLEKGIGTPTPIAYFEESDFLGLKSSFYVCEFINYDMRFRELLDLQDEDERVLILKKFTQFTYKIHENNINFKDHSAGNTLIKKNGDDYDFYLVDLNRTSFDVEMSFEDQLRNFSKLTSKKEIIQIMSQEYALLCQKNALDVFHLMWQYTQEFQYNFKRKRRWKIMLKFWKKKQL